MKQLTRPQQSNGPKDSRSASATDFTTKCGGPISTILREAFTARWKSTPESRRSGSGAPARVDRGGLDSEPARKRLGFRAPARQSAAVTAFGREAGRGCRAADRRREVRDLELAGIIRSGPTMIIPFDRLAKRPAGASSGLDCRRTS